MIFHVSSPAGVETIRANDPDAAVDAVLGGVRAGGIGDRVIWFGDRVVAIVHPSPDGGNPRVTMP